MDQDTTNSPGKARWRERLGMGNASKDMPKISDEFKPAAAPAKPAPPRDAKSAPVTPQGHQPVIRPAPMAPRTPAPMAPRVPPQAQSKPQQQQQPPPQPPPQPQSQSQQPARPVAPLPKGATGLGDRLRAERQAAERLAEQRVAQARGSRPAAPPLAQPGAAPQSHRPAQPERPKFSFSPEELAKDKREATSPSSSPVSPPEREYPSFAGKAGAGTAPPPLTPPRPALGGTPPASLSRPPQSPQPPTRGPAAQLPAGPSFQPRYNGPAQPAGGNYRSLDPPPAGGFTPKSRPYADTAAFREDPLARRDAPLPRSPVNREYDSYRRGPALPPAAQPQAYGEGQDGPALPDYRRRPQAPARGRQPAPPYDEDVNEVFEDEEPPRPQRRRASAQDYNRAYRDYEEGYEPERRRRGPWPALLAILLGGIILTGGIIYYYLTYMKPQGQATGGNVPVIEAPDQSPKAAPESSGGSTLGTQGSAQPTDAQRKQIYDRILGDDEVNSGSQMVPTQEQPQPVEPTGTGEGQDAAPFPTPSSGTQDNTGEPLPLPLPPPGATDQQGSLSNGAGQQTAAAGAVGQTTASQIPEPASTSSADDGAPVPGELARAAEEIAAAPPPTAEQVVSEPEALPPQPQPAKPKVKAEKKPVKQTAAAEEAVDPGASGAAEPLVLVPPAQPPVANAAPMLESAPAHPASEGAASEEKSRSFFNLGSGPTGKRKLTGKAAENAQARGGASGNWANAPDPNAVAAESSGAAPQQIAAIEPVPEPQPIPLPAPEQPAQQANPSGGGFSAQLASFRSEAEAQAEFDRLSAKHSGVLSGLNPRIVKATVAGAPRYRLSVGPMASKAQASKVCESLISAGERDCLVRGN